MIDEFTMREAAITRSRSTRIHYSGELRTRSKHSTDGFRFITAGYAACVDGDRAKGIALVRAGRTTDARDAVTCKVCRSLMAHAAALIASEAAPEAKTPTPEISARVQGRIEDHFDTLRVCQETVDRAREDDELTETPGCAELLAFYAIRDDAAASSGWLHRMRAESHNLGMGPEFDALEKNHLTVPNYTIRLSEAAQAKRENR